MQTYHIEVDDVSVQIAKRAEKNRKRERLVAKWREADREANEARKYEQDWSN